MKNKRIFKLYFQFSLKDTFISIFILTVTFVLCCVLQYIDDAANFVTKLYLLAVFLIAFFTKGCVYGIVSSFVSILLINYFFTYPFYRFDFTLAGYPLTILCSLVVAIITSFLTTQIKEHSVIKLEAEKEKTRSNLLRSVSHDLRTPLTSIIGASSAISENFDTLSKEKILELLSEISDDAQWLIRMVENILSITRFDEDGNAVIVKNDEVVDEIIEISVTKFKKYFPETEVSVEVPDELLIVPMDATLIEQVIVNLLENSAIHSKNSEKIELTVKREGNNAVFEVADFGVGIDEKILPKIFQSKHKTQSMNENDKKKNMGIGLSVCDTIVRAHNGSMSASNKSTGGAVFRFSLPLEGEKNEEYSSDC